MDKVRSTASCNEPLPATMEEYLQLVDLLVADAINTKESNNHGFVAYYSDGKITMYDEDDAADIDDMSFDACKFIAKLLCNAGWGYWEFGCARTTWPRCPLSESGYAFRIHNDASISYGRIVFQEEIDKVYKHGYITGNKDGYLMAEQEPDNG